MKENQHWYYIVRNCFTDNEKVFNRHFNHKEKEEALKRARGYMNMCIENLCNNYRMGSHVTGVHTHVFQLFFAESSDEGKTYVEELIEEKRASEFLGNHAV